MKSFKKNSNNYFVCEECLLTFKTKEWLSRHIGSNHNLKEYFDKWILDINENKCKVCGKETDFKSSFNGYKNCCSKKCSSLLLIKNNKEKYGVENVSQSKIIKNKIRDTNLKNCGYSSNFGSPSSIELKKKTWIKNYGVDNPLKSSKVYEKIKKTNLKRYGVEYTHQNKDILEKSLKSSKKLKIFKDTNLWYQGSYELDFLNRYYEVFPDIQRGPSIRYIFNGKDRVYHSDFYIPSLNLVIEIKSSWILNIDIEIEEKKKATIYNGFNYIMILDKNYKDFNIVSSSIPLYF